MVPILKLDKDDKEIDFELKYLASLSTNERFEMMFKKTKEIVALWEKSGHRKPFKITKRE